MTVQPADIPAASGRSQFLRFLVVGVGAFAAYVATQAAAVELARLSVVAATAIAFIVGTIVSYIGNALWSFEARPSLSNISRFLLITGLGFLLNIGAAALLDRLGVHYVVIAIVVFAVVPVLNFVGHRFFSFRPTGGTLGGTA